MNHNNKDVEAGFGLEAEVFTRYLVSGSVGAQEKDRYIEAMKKLDLKLSNYEQVLLNKMLRNNWSLSVLDSGLALVDSTNLVRRKLFTMLAILEASPNYTTSFFSDNFSFGYYFKLIWVSFRAVIKAIIGIILVKKIQRKCI